MLILSNFSNKYFASKLQAKNQIHYLKMKYLLLILILCLVSQSFSKLVFSDDFDELDMKKWKHDITMAGGGNNEFQIYENNRSTSWVSNSTLNIRPVLTEDKIGSNNVRKGYTYEFWGSSPAEYCTASFNNGCSRTSDGVNYINPVMSAKLTTVNSFSFKYGRVEVRAKLPIGDWLWPAIWMMPRYNQYGTWPASGEIDILESRGNVGYPQSVGGGPEMFVSTLHWGPQPSKNQFYKTHEFYTHTNGTLADDFHTYGLYWDDKVFYTYIDDDSKRVLQVNHSDISYWQRSGITDRENPWQSSPNKCAPFDSEFYLIINLAVGGTIGYFPDGLGNKPWKDSSSRASAEFYDNKAQWFKTWGPQSTFKIDSVKVWDLGGKQEERKSLRKQVIDQ